MQEADRFHRHMDFFAGLEHRDLVERFDRAVGLTLAVAEGREIMRADQMLGGGVHGFHIKRLIDAPDLTAGQGEGRAPCVQAVDIAAPVSLEAGVKLVRDAHRLDHRNGVGFEMMIDRVAHLVGGEILFKIHMGDLTEGMDAGIGPPCAIDLARAAIELGGGGFQRALHRGAIVLPLPTHERAAIIFDGELVARHG